MSFFCPVFEDVGELMVGDDDVFIDVRYAIDVIEHTVQDGAVAYLEQGFGEIFGQLAKSGGIAGCNYDGFQFGLRFEFAFSEPLSLGITEASFVLRSLTRLFEN